MVNFAAGFESYGFSRKIEIVKGKEYSANQAYIVATRPPPARNSLEYPTLTLPGQNRSKAQRGTKPKKKRFSLSLSDPELKRKKRIVKYKYYVVEGKVKDGFKRGVRWIKKKCSMIVNGF
ncbi:hypothetical protein ACHQM5_026349 [Ranunculus cassubicifolius]